MTVFKMEFRDRLYINEQRGNFQNGVYEFKIHRSTHLETTWRHTKESKYKS